MKKLIHDKWHILVTAFVCVIFGGFFAAFLQNTADLKKDLIREAERHAVEVNGKLADYFSDYLNTNLYIVTELAHTLSLDSEPPKGLLTTHKEEFGLDTISILGKQDAPAEDSEAKERAEQWQDANPHIWEEPLITCNEENALVFSAPILLEEAPADYLVLGTKSYEELYRQVFGSDSSPAMGMLLDGSGALVAGPVGSEQLLGADLKDALYEGFFEELAAEVQQNVLEAQGAFSVRVLTDEQLLVSAHRLGINDWIQVILLPWSPGRAYLQHLENYLWLGIQFVIASSIMIVYVMVLQTRAKNKLDQVAYCDFVTGGITNRAFQSQCVERLRRSEWTAHAIIYFDICNFKHVNEKWGIENGNRILQHVYNCFRKNIRSDELVTRSEMDHYFLLLHGNSEEEFQQRVDALVQVINSFHGVYQEQYHLNFTVGAYVFHETEERVQALQDHARRAAKFSDALNTCTFYNNKIIEKIERENRLNLLFEESLKNHDFQIYLQPKVYLQQQRPCASEALVRWVHPQEGMIYPSEFIPLFEENGKICELDIYVFEEVCKIIDRWRREGRTLSEISVNISRVHIKKMQTGFQERYLEIKEKYHIPDGIIQLELTETSMFYAQQYPYVTEMIQNFHNAGFTCALDDFGFGYSSLSMLKEFNVDTIKLDRSFFVNESEKSRIVVANMIRLAHDMDIQIVAEGIEEAEQVNSLIELGCDLIQGYYYAKPLPVTEFEHWKDSEMERFHER